MDNAPAKQTSRLPVPPARLTAALAAAMLAVGVAVGAAIGPAPDSSLATPANLPALLATLAARAASSAHASATVEQPAASATATPAGHRRKRHHHAAVAATASEEATSAASEPSAPASTPSKSSQPKTVALAPTNKVWLIQLDGSTFAEALAHASSAPYISGQAIAAGALLSNWSSLQGSAFAGDAALIAGPAPQLIDTITQPPCPEGAAGASCAAGTPGALAAADEFLEATIPTITSLGTFRKNGLIVVTFASVGSATATGLPAGASTATLTAEPPAGVLLVSPFVAVGSRPTTTFNPASPQQSLEKLLHA